MNLTKTEIRSIAEKHVDAWHANLPPKDNRTLADYVADAIGEALTKQEKLYRDGAETMRFERDKALALGVVWGTGIPDVASGAREQFWCAYRNSSGKVNHRFLTYANAYIMDLSDSCHEAPKCAVPVGDDGEYSWTGWLEESCDQCETQWTFDKEVIAWLRLPTHTCPTS